MFLRESRMRLYAAGMAFALAGLAAGMAQAAPDYPAGSEALERSMLASLDTYWQNWVKDQARQVVSSGRISEDRARSLAEGAHMAAGGDVNTISFLLLMQAARDADADLQSTMDRSRDEHAEQDELSSMAHTQAPVISQLSPETQTVLSMRAKTKPIMTLHSSEAPSPVAAPTADVDLSIHLDLQTAMDRQAAAEDALTAAVQRVPLARSASLSNP
jgi:hypothetical protein